MAKTRGSIRRAYFAHPMSDYGTNRESQAVAQIELYFKGDWEVVNPNHRDHEDGYRERGDFSYWTDLAGGCDVVVYMAMPGGWIGSGVWKEVHSALKAGRRAYEIDRNAEHILRVEMLDPERLLSIEETKRTVRMLIAQRKGL